MEGNFKHQNAYSGYDEVYSIIENFKERVQYIADFPCYDDDSDNATGFVFTEPAPYELLNCLRRVLIFYLQDKGEFQRIRKNAMKIRYSWEKSASEYETMYRSALESPQRI